MFYDEFFKHELWGKDLFQYLASIYRDKAKFCLVFVSNAYKNKVWPKHQLRQAPSLGSMMKVGAMPEASE